jgi:hypothetical protein
MHRKSFSSLFPEPAKSLRELAFDTFNWLYERSPLTFGLFTGMRHPSIPS